MCLSNIVILFIFLCDISGGSRRIYETIRNRNAIGFDCLYHLITDDIDLPGMKIDIRIENIPFCRQSSMVMTDDLSFNENSTIINGEQWTFDYLRQMNISARQLFDWYAPIDVIEEYLLEKKSGIFVNCSEKGNFWFGNRCQYTFDSSDQLKDLLWDRFDAKDYSAKDLLSITNGTCYPIPNNQCQSILCLDWREICDGKIDCLNGFDERHCHELEENECDEIIEYRCLNGQCIDKSFYRDQYPDCMDYSDEKLASAESCFYKFDVRCEDRWCPSMWFSCGDGYCYDGPNIHYTKSCRSQRDDLYFKQMPLSTLILFSHIYFIYNDTKAEFICYNDSSCPYLSTTNHFEITTISLNGLTCRSLNNQTYRTSFDMIKNMKRLVRSCSLLPEMKQCSLFECDDGSKCLSQHRLLDGYEDCSNGEDELENGTCKLNNPYRFMCDDGKRCIHPSSVADRTRNCADGSDETRTTHYLCFDTYVDECRTFRREPRRFNVTFEQLCNGIIEVKPDLEGNTDESDCLENQWRCRRPHTICDNVWNCPNGEDELGCGKPNLVLRHCNTTTHFCLDIQTGLSRCLSAKEAGDGIINCVGSSDERSFCRIKYPYESVRRYRCQNSDLCISPFQVCDCHQDCPLNDDETIACKWINNGRTPWCDRTILRCRNGILRDDVIKNFRCDGMIFHCEDGEDELFCDLIDEVRGQQIFLLEMEEYPKRFRRQLSSSNPVIVWYCNRGLYVRSSENPSGFVCLCPVYYYGVRCQFQRKRLTLIFQVQMVGSFDQKSPTTKFVVLLIRQNNTTTIILSHEQFIYTPLKYCLPKYIAHLVYPIHDSLSLLSNDSIQIHMFIGSTVEYRTSWTFPIPFQFLPVQRIVKRLLVSHNSIIDQSIDTMIVRKNSSSCSGDSFYLGYDVNLNRDVCVCTLNRIGSRCLIPFNPCNENSCKDHGECVASDERFPSDSQFRCICNYQWFGNRCENEKFRISVSFKKDIIISLSSIIVLHVIIPQKFREPTYLSSFNRLQREIFNLTFFFDYTSDTDEFNGLIAFIQLFTDLHHVDYYLLILHNAHTQISQEIHSEINPSRRCRSINELFNNTILNQPYLRRVKNYQQLCFTQNLTNQQFQCFNDEQLICLCDKTKHINCWSLNSSVNACPWNKCGERGICMQNHQLCPTSSLCLCEPCSYGSLCQFLSNGYILSLDGIIGSHIRPMVKNISDQSRTVQVTLTIVIILVLIGIILNIISLGTFSVKSTQEVGCGLYLLISSFIGLLTIIILMCKMILLLVDKQNNVSCSLIEFVLKWFPTSCEWLNACVAIERSSTIIYKTRFSRTTSKRLSKRIIIIVIIFIALICSPELIFRRMIIDTLDERIWCVLNLNHNRPRLLMMYRISNILLFLLPVIINLASGTIIIISVISRSQQQARLKSNRNINQTSRFEMIKHQILKHKHILIGPILLAVLSVPRILFLFIFVCTKLDQRPYLNLFGYLVGFVPSMFVLFAFILPSRSYRSALVFSMKRMLPNRIQN